MKARHLAALLAVLPFAGAGAAERACDQSESIVSAAPGGRLAASVQHQVCETSTGGVGAAVTVYVGEAAAPLKGSRVVAIAVPRSREEWPVAVWRSASSLEVWVPNLAQVLETQPGHADVSLTLRYCGDDPAARDRVARHADALKAWMESVSRWNEARKLDAKAAGPRPERPADPPRTSRACTDADIAAG